MTIRWGIIGAGGIAIHRMIPTMMESEQCKLTAIMNTNSEKLAAVQQQFGIGHAYATVEELVSSGLIDAVYIASPVYVHAEQAILCAKAGIPVFVEKPVGMNVHELEAIRQACSENDVFFEGALMMRYHYLHRQAQSMIESGMIGTPVMVRMNFSFWYPEEGNSWRQQKNRGGGGVFMDLGPHCLDLMQFVIGQPIKKIRGAWMNTQTFSYEVEDSATLLLEMERGTHATISTHFNIPEDVAANRFEIYGTDGVIVLEGTMAQVESGTLLYKPKGNVDYEQITCPKFDEKYSLYRYELKHFIDLMGNPSLWNSVMSEQIRLQALLDDAYRIANNT